VYHSSISTTNPDFIQTGETFVDRRTDGHSDWLRVDLILIIQPQCHTGGKNVAERSVEILHNEVKKIDTGIQLCRQYFSSFQRQRNKPSSNSFCLVWTSVFSL